MTFCPHRVPCGFCPLCGPDPRLIFVEVDSARCVRESLAEGTLFDLVEICCVRCRRYVQITPLELARIQEEFGADVRVVCERCGVPQPKGGKR